MKVVLVGSVSSSEVVLLELIHAKVPVAMVFSLDESAAENVSGYRPIHKIAQQNRIPNKTFRKINDIENVELLRSIKPDYIFVVGISQLVGEQILSTAKEGAIGFHPTPLPKYRGRAAMVWQMLLGVRETKCTMFFINEGMDSGDIIAQETYMIGEMDYAEDVEVKLLEAIKPLAKNVIKQIMSGCVARHKQNEEEATYLLKRTPEDGMIDWNQPVEEIHLLIRAISKPYPGAYSHYDGKKKIIIWRANVLENRKYIGLPGQIAYKDENGFYVVCRNGLLHVTEYENVESTKLLVGHKLR